MLPIYWLINMSLKTNSEILGGLSRCSRNLTLPITSDPHRPSWYLGYINSLIYVTLNTVISPHVALPAAYAFSRYNSSATSICSSGC
jgi:glycerol transport system permease protein